MLKSLLRWVYWYPFRLTVQKLPIVWLLASGRAVGALLFKFAAGKVAPFMEAGAIFGFDKAPIVKRAMKIFYQNEFEALFYPKLNEKNIASIVACEGIGHLDKALEEGRGAMLLFAHFGANQMIMPAIGYRGYKMSQLSAPYTIWQEKWPKDRKPDPMRDLGHKMRWELEQSLPVRHINIFGSLKDAIKNLKRNEVLGVAMDGGGGENRIMAEFLGKKAFFSTGSIDLALRTGCAVLPTFILRGENGRHKMTIEAPMLVSEEGESKEDSIKRNIGKFVNRLEDYARKYPCHYLGFLAFRKFMSDHGDPTYIEGWNERG